MVEPRRGRRTAAILVVAVLVAIGAFVAGRASTGAEGTPSDSSAAAGFARDMQVHHRQGVELALLARDRSHNEELRLLAYDIARGQEQQAGQMFGWLSAWGLPQAGSEPSMTWMTRPALDGTGHEHDAEGAHTPGDPMPGLATREQIAELTALSGDASDKYFLELMIAHHEGAIAMAEAVLDRTHEKLVLGLARNIITTQSSEIDYMKALLAQYE
jgi:uncharacterized protein (DUF305 family)